jgi:hypothetical protein
MFVLLLSLRLLVPADDLRGVVQELLSVDPTRQELARARLFSAPHLARPLLGAKLAQADPRSIVLILDLLREFPRAEWPASVLPLLGHSHPAVRTAAAGFSGRHLQSLEVLPAALWSDPVPSVLEEFLGELLRRPYAVRQRFADAHCESLSRCVHSPERPLRRRALQLLADASAARSGYLWPGILPDLLTEERELLLDRLVERPRSWPSATLASTAELLQQRRADRQQRCDLLRYRAAPHNAAPLTLHALATLLQAVLDSPRREQDAALALLQARRTQALPLYLSALKSFADHAEFPTAVEIYWQLRGPAALADLIALVQDLIREEHRQEAAIHVLGALDRAPSVQTAQDLDAALSAEFPVELWPALTETVLRLPECAARSRIMLLALHHEEARLRAFEGLTRQGDPVHIQPLLAAIRSERRTNSRSRMVQLLAEPYGALEPEAVFGLLRELMNSSIRSDRQAALSAVAYVALGDQAEPVAQLLVDRFLASEPDRLLFVLSQIGGDLVESTFQQLADEFAGDETPERYRFLLRQAGRLGGKPSLELLRAALDAPEEALRQQAAESLLERQDEFLLHRAVEVLADLEAGNRVWLLGELDVYQTHAAFRPLVQQLSETYRDDDSLSVLLRIGTARAPAETRGLALSLVAKAKSAGLRHVAVETLGMIGGQEAEQLLTELLRIPADLEAGSEEAQEAESLARSAALALRRLDPEIAVDELAAVLVRQELRQSRSRLPRSSVGLRVEQASSDPVIIGVLGALPSRWAIKALSKHLPSSTSSTPAPAEEFFLSSAQALEFATRDGDLGIWLAKRVLASWPARSAADLAALLGLLDAPILQGDLRGIAPQQLGGIAQLEELYAAHPPHPRLQDRFFGARSPMRGRSAERTLRTLSILAETSTSAAQFPASCLRRAAREAHPDSRLLASLAELAAAADRALAHELVVQALTLAPHDPLVLGSYAWLADLDGRRHERDWAVAAERQLHSSGFAQPGPTASIQLDALFLARQAWFLLRDGDQQGARRRLREALRLHPSLILHNPQDPAVRALVAAQLAAEGKR